MIHSQAELPEHCLPLLLRVQAPWRARHQEGAGEEKKTTEKKSTDGFAEVQIRANDLIVGRSVGRR